MNRWARFWDAVIGWIEADARARDRGAWSVTSSSSSATPSSSSSTPARAEASPAAAEGACAHREAEGALEGLAPLAVACALHGAAVGVPCEGEAIGAPEPSLFAGACDARIDAALAVGLGYEPTLLACPRHDRPVHEPCPKAAA